jgi:hypothetical protein
MKGYRSAYAVSERGVRSNTKGRSVGLIRGKKKEVAVGERQQKLVTEAETELWPRQEKRLVIHTFLVLLESKPFPHSLI